MVELAHGARPLASIPFGQCTTSGLRVPPKCVYCLHSLNGVLPAAPSRQDSGCTSGMPKLVDAGGIAVQRFQIFGAKAGTRAGLLVRRPIEECLHG